LIELLVVILIIGILIAIAVPTFLNQQQKAQNSAAQQTLAVAYKDAKANMATNGGTFSDYQTLAAQIASAEPEYTVGTAIFSSDQAVTAGPYGKLWVLLGSTGSNGTLASTNGQNLYLADVSKSGTVCTLTVTNDGPPVYGGCGGASSGSAGVVVVAPASGAVSISGTAKEGQSLTANNSNWSGNPTYSYQWQDCDQSGNNCTAIAGANQQTYTLVSTDVDNTVRVLVSASNAGGSAQTTSPQTGVVVAGSAPAESVLPKLSGNSQEGQTIATTTGTWVGSGAKTYTYQWQSSPDNSTWSAISGATANSYTLPPGSAGTYYRAIVTATSSGGSTPATSSNTSGAVAETYAEQVLTDNAPNAHPFAFWQFDSGSLTDTIAMHTGSIGLSSTITTTDSGPILGDSSNKALSFDGGSGTYATMPDTNSSSCSRTAAGLSASNGAPTGCVFNSTVVELWFKTTSDGTLISEQTTPYTTTPGSGWMNALYIGTDGYLRGALFNYGIVSSLAPVTDGKWHDAILSLYGTTQSLYLDGVLQNTTTGNWTNTPYSMVYSALGVGETSLWPDGNGSYFHYTGDIGPVVLTGAFGTMTQPIALAHYQAANPANFAIQ
jgi:type II secretory pathway pseudopilin PulG